MNTRAAVTVGSALVVGIVALWPRGSGQVDGAPPVAAVPEPAAQAAAGAAGVEGAAPPAGPSLHARIVKSSREGPPAIPDAAFDEMGPEQSAKVRSPLFGLSREERLEAHRAGVIWPEAPTVKGPPGKPEIATGSTRDEVRAAWGAPVSINPASVEMRVPLPDSDAQMETDRLERNEAWFYDVGDGLRQSIGFFDADGKLTPFMYSRESEAARAAEREALMLKIEQRREARRRGE